MGLLFLRALGVYISPPLPSLFLLTIQLISSYLLEMAHDEFMASRPRAFGKIVNTRSHVSAVAQESLSGTSSREQNKKT